MERLHNMLMILDKSLGTKRRRHITGGILMSVSILFGGLAFTVMSLRMEDEEDDGRQF